jgi:NosR/NirI family transcriptional regulator, nitrous oxide reductase regulator
MKSMLSRIGFRIRGILWSLALLPAGIGLAQDDAGDDLWGFDEIEDVDPTLFELAADQAPDILLFAAFAALALTSFLRKSIPLKYVTLVASVAYMGIYKSQLLSVVNVFGSVSSVGSLLTGEPRNYLPIFSYSLAWYAFFAFTVVTTIVWGRVYCGRICAFGALTQLLDAVVPSRLQLQIPAWLERRAGYIKYGILFGAIGYYLLTGEIAFYRYIEPFWIFTFDATTVLWVTLALLLIASIFVRNLYCRFLCPLGAALGILSTLTMFRIKRWSECSTCAVCEKTCEWGAIRNRKIIAQECVRCDDCEILYADEANCPHWLLDAKRKRRAAAEESPLLPASQLRKSAGRAP